jgi:hypothetical protein
MKQNINVNIEGIDLPLSVSSPEEEKVYRDATILIQKRLRSLREFYPNLPSDKYYYAMAMLYTAVDAVRAENAASTEPFMTMMADLDHELQQALN